MNKSNEHNDVNEAISDIESNEVYENAETYNDNIKSNDINNNQEKNEETKNNQINRNENNESNNNSKSDKANENNEERKNDDKIIELRNKIEELREENILLKRNADKLLYQHFNKKNIMAERISETRKNERETMEIKKEDEIEKLNINLKFDMEKKNIINGNELFNLENELLMINAKNDLKKKIAIANTEHIINIHPYSSYKKPCCNLNFFQNQNVIDNFEKIYEIVISLPSLTNYEKNLILLRFSELSSYCIKKYNNVSKFYKISQIFIIICSIINPALLSINVNQNNSNYFYIFWLVWILQLLVSLVTGFVSWFKWDKKNFLFNIYKTKINKEIWLFIELTGKNYKLSNGEYNHSQYINLFLNRLENIHTQLKISEFETENNNDNDNVNSQNPSQNTKPNDNNNNNAQNILMSRQVIPPKSDNSFSKSQRFSEKV